MQSQVVSRPTKVIRTGHLTSGRNNNTVDVLVLKGKMFFLFFLASYNRIIIVYNKNILTIAIINLSSSEKHYKEHSTGGSCLSRTAVKPDSHFAQIFVAKFLCIIKLIIITG